MLCERVVNASLYVCEAGSDLKALPEGCVGRGASVVPQTDNRRGQPLVYGDGGSGQGLHDLPLCCHKRDGGGCSLR